MSFHFIHYIKLDITGSSSDKYLGQVKQGLNSGFERPEFHLTKEKEGPCRKIKPGDTIWLFSSIKSPWGRTSPSLDAKVIVKNKKRIDHNMIQFLAGTGSKWFPFCDATKLLIQLRTIDQKGNRKKLWPDTSRPLGIYLQSIRKIDDGSSLIEWDNKISKSDFDFISYKIKDGTRLAFEKTNELLTENKLVFWDRFSLPRRLTERAEEVSERSLDKHLINAIKKASVVWGIESPLYFQEGSYSLKEYLLAKKLGKYRSAG